MLSGREYSGIVKYSEARPAQSSEGKVSTVVDCNLKAFRICADVEDWSLVIMEAHLRYIAKIGSKGGIR
jgi:hypothetical protein